MSSEEIARRRAEWRERTARHRARLREQVRVLLGERCQDCGLSEDEDFEPVRLDLAHVGRTKLRGRGRGSKERLRDALANPESYALLCRRCHMDRDYAGEDPWEPREPDPNKLELKAVPF